MQHTDDGGPDRVVAVSALYPEEPMQDHDVAKATDAPQLFRDYTPDEFFDEVFTASGAPRDHYRPLVDWLASIDPAELDRRQDLREGIFRSLGITFSVYGDGEGTERTFPLDLVPRIQTS